MTTPQGARRAVWLVLFAVAMGFLEAIVVIYLRELFYPNGFGFPVVIIPERLALAEWVREVTTVLMILSVAVLAGGSRIDRFFVFGFVFGVWDLAYYVGLWLFLGWPASLMTWDVLFLIPVPWLGPVLYPTLVSLLLIVGFLVHDGLRVRERVMSLTRSEWAVASVGGLLVVVAFCWNWRVVGRFATPASFPAWLYFPGLVAGVAPFVRAARRATRERVG